ncbi:hypothetical protein AAFF_G00081390 [Aldrovandia affinis]|uniref:Uncharacterized protein n=1 Tax=Aldrovandia affinis TaxID=143900 RepID=A0AAD7T4K7_9TELE|nr:hypothetical protein AAFF_G00081390 [Aldrovandia affinis]
MCSSCGRRESLCDVGARVERAAASNGRATGHVLQTCLRLRGRAHCRACVLTARGCRCSGGETTERAAQWWESSAVTREQLMVVDAASRGPLDSPLWLTPAFPPCRRAEGELTRPARSRELKQYPQPWQEADLPLST